MAFGNLCSNIPARERVINVYTEYVFTDYVLIDYQSMLLQVKDLKTHFPITQGALFRRHIGDIKAVDGVTFSIRQGEIVGLVGESGCGKTTVAKSILKLEPPTAGEVRFDGVDIWSQSAKEEARYRRRVQAIFQDPMSSLNPRMRVRDIVGEPLLVHQREIDSATRLKRVRHLLSLCGLPRRFIDLYPHEMSGGQRQRVGVARALALNPDLIVCDEPVSALDVSIQAQIINLLVDLKDELGLTYLFIGHDLSVVRHICDRVAVMYLGRIVETGGSDDVFDNPQHPYTKALLEAVPIPDPQVEDLREHQVLAGEVPSPLNPPSGCVFHPRCPIAVSRCTQESPALEPADSTTDAMAHMAACWAVAPSTRRAKVRDNLQTSP